MGRTADNTAKAARWTWIACFALFLLKLWMTASQRVWAIGPAWHDDRHFLTQAVSLLDGKWLGPYDQMTLIKGPFFPAWIGGVFLLGIPLLLSAQLLYAAACWGLTVGVRRLLRREAYIPLVFGVLLFNPESNSVLLTRVLREMITPALTLLVAACAIGLVRAEVYRSRSGWYWAAGLGLTFAALWHTREEEMVVLPALLIGLGVAAVAVWKARKWEGLRGVAQHWFLALGLFLAVAGFVAGVNYRYYRVFAKTEFETTAFQAAYGALVRVKPEEYIPYVPVTRETRKRIYAISPAFRELRPFLDGSLGAFWASVGAGQPGGKPASSEIQGGWFDWALRDSVAAAGYYQNGTFPAAYYSRLANEVNAACTNGKLECYAPRATMAPIWHFRYVPAILADFPRRIWETVSYRYVPIGSQPSWGSQHSLAVYAALTGGVEPSDEYSLEIATDSSVVLKVDGPDGKPIPFDAFSGSSPEFPVVALKGGDSLQAAPSAAYALAAQCSDQCALEVDTGTGAPVHIKFADPSSGLSSAESAGVHVQVISLQPPVAPIPEAALIDQRRLAALTTVLRAYQLVIPPLAAVGLLVYAVLGIEAVQSRRQPGMFLVLTGLLALATSRMALISLLDVTTLPVPLGTYLYEAYPPILAFSVLAGTGAVELLISATRRRMGAQGPRTPPEDGGAASTRGAAI